VIHGAKVQLAISLINQKTLALLVLMNAGALVSKHFCVVAAFAGAVS